MGWFLFFLPKKKKKKKKKQGQTFADVAAKTYKDLSTSNSLGRKDS